MRSIIRYPSLLLLVAAMAFAIGIGCSNQSPTGSLDGNVATDISQAVASAVGEPTFVETFDKNSNVGGFSFFGDIHNRIEIYEPQGGNPGAYLHATCGQFGCLDTYAPQLGNQIGFESVFTGSYRDHKVTRVGVDIAIFGAANTGWRPLSLMLRNDGGTPDDYTDDVLVFWTGNKMIPMPNGVFKEFVFDIPSQSRSLPKGWKVMYGYSTGDDDADWNTVMNNVSQITFFFGDPEMFFMFQLWDIGVDNTRIWFEN